MKLFEVFEGTVGVGLWLINWQHGDLLFYEILSEFIGDFDWSLMNEKFHLYNTLNIIFALLWISIIY